MTQQEKIVVDLPHGATLDHEGIISFPLGSVVLKFALEEWATFFEMVDDLNVVIQANTREDVIQCPTCNTIESYIRYEEPEDEEIN